MAKQQLIDEMSRLWKTKRKLIVSELSHEDGWDDRIEWLKKSDPYKYDGTDDQVIEAFLEERYEDFMNEFDSNAEDADGELMIYRCMTVADADEFAFNIAHGIPAEDYKGLGIYWSWKEDAAQAHWGGHGEPVTIHALVPFSSINPLYTLTLNLSPALGEDEAEIRLKPGAPLSVLGINLDDRNGDHYLSPLDDDLDPIPMSAGYPAVSKILAD